MALPTILINNATGSDTAASGAGPSTALTGTGAATVSASNVTTLLVDNPNLSGVDTTGLAVLWVSSSSGRQYSKITAVDNTGGVKTVTTEDNFANTEGSRTWGIGGKRKTVANANTNRVLSTDAKAGWIIEVQDNQTVTTSTALLSNSADYMILRGVAGSRPVINNTANAQSLLLNTGWKVQNLQFTNSNAAHPRPVSLNLTGINSFERCVFGDATNTIATVFDRVGGSPRINMNNCEIKNCTGFGILSTLATITNVSLDGCWIHDNVGGISLNSPSVTIQHCLIEDNTSDGIIFGTGAFDVEIANNTIDGNSGDGIDLSAAVLLTQGSRVYSNNITANGAYGIAPSTGINLCYEDYNNFGTGATANTSGDLNGLTKGSHSLAVDPAYVDPTTNNFSVGAALYDKGFPDATIQIGAGSSGTFNFSTIGCAEPDVVAGGGNINLLTGKL